MEVKRNSLGSAPTLEGERAGWGGRIGWLPAPQQAQGCERRRCSSRPPPGRRRAQGMRAFLLPFTIRTRRYLGLQIHVSAERAVFLGKPGRFPKPASRQFHSAYGLYLEELGRPQLTGTGRCVLPLVPYTTDTAGAPRAMAPRIGQARHRPLWSCSSSLAVDYPRFFRGRGRGRGAVA
jgi:hypothetical protein